MAEHPADVDKADDAQRHPLQFAAGAVAQDRHEQNKRDGEDRHGHEKPIPARCPVLRRADAALATPPPP